MSPRRVMEREWQKCCRHPQARCAVKVRVRARVRGMLARHQQRK